MKPEKPRKAIAIWAVMISVSGKPLKDFAIGAVLSFSRRAAIAISTREKPMPPPVPDMTASMKLYPSRTLITATPRTAQLVVISGRYIPKRPVKGGAHLQDDHLDELHQRCYYQDEGYRLEEAQSQGNEQIVLHKPRHRSRKAHNEDYGRSHAHGGIELVRDADERASTHYSGQHIIVDQDCAKKDYE